MKVDGMGFLMLVVGILLAMVAVVPLWNSTVGAYVPSLAVTA